VGNATDRSHRLIVQKRNEDRGKGLAPSGVSTCSAKWRLARRSRPQRWWLAAGWIPLILACSCGEADRPAPLAGYDVVLVVVDALRADHLGAYAYARDTSRFIDSLARQGIVFESAIANSSYTRESVAALLTGQLPSRNGAFGWLATPERAGPHLGEIFRRAGYRTGFLSNTVQLQSPGFTRGFDEVRHLPSRFNLSGEGDRLSASASDFVRRAGERPIFLYLHYLDPHAPYDPAPHLHRRFAPVPHATPLALYGDVVPGVEELLASGFGPGEPRFEDLIARYDAEIASTDEALESLLGSLESLGRRDRTLLVLTADHGEEFLEHGFVEHAWTLYEESIQVPLIFWAAGELEPARVAQRVSLVDVMPTVLALVGIETADGELDGISLLERNTGRPIDPPPSRPHIAELLLGKRNVVRAVIRDEWKYLAVHRWVAPEQRGSPDGKPELESSGVQVREELYHLAEDPLEQQDRSADSPRRLASMRAILRQYLRSTKPDSGASRPTGREPAAEISPGARERLRALGYIQDE
jgi:arylsulfatase